jgi:hypothetical protein
MKKMSRLDEFRRATAAARHRAAAETAPRPAEPGDIYLFPGEGDLATRWAVLAIHPDRPDLLFAVPGDGHPLYGLADAPLSDKPGHRFTLRCGLGLWLPRDAFRGDRFLRTLSTDQLRRARAKARQIVAASADGPEAARESEADLEYRGWMELVAAAVDRLASAIRTRAVVITPAEFEPTLPFGRLPSAEAAPAAMAAASPGMADETVPPQPPPPSPRAYRVVLAHPGETWLLLETAGVAVLFRAEAGIAPPAAFSADTSGGWQPLTWAGTPGGTGARAFTPWIAGALRLRFGENDEFSQEVTVPRP